MLDLTPWLRFFFYRKMFQAGTESTAHSVNASCRSMRSWTKCLTPLPKQQSQAVCLKSGAGKARPTNPWAGLPRQPSLLKGLPGQWKPVPEDKVDFMWVWPLASIGAHVPTHTSYMRTNSKQITHWVPLQNHSFWLYVTVLKNTFFPWRFNYSERCSTARPHSRVL